MTSNLNEDDLDLLDAAAKVFRDRAVSGSRFNALLETAAASEPSSAIETRHPGRNERDSIGGDRGELELPCTQRLARSVESSMPQIGDMPPQPPTMRGRFGAVLVGFVRRALFWYTGQMQVFHARVADAARELTRVLPGLDAQQRRQHGVITGVLQRLNELERQFAAAKPQLSSVHQNTADQEQRLSQLAQRFTSFEQTRAASDVEESRHWERLAVRLEKIDEALTAAQKEARQKEMLDARLERIDEALAKNEQILSSFENKVKQAFKAEVKELRQHLHDARMQLLQHELRLKMLMQEIRKRPPDQSEDSASGIAAELRHFNDSLFVDHARSFRGPRSDIKNRLMVYVPYAREAFAATKGAAALDLGCGRGEWLELLRENGIAATGIDHNRELVSGCREMGLDAMVGDVSQTLRSFADESRSIITAFHVIEHISFPELLDLVDHAVRLLRPGGIAIFETPNPKNLLVSSNNFYLDPTHRQPLPSEFLAFVVEARGLCEPKVIPLSPYPDYFHLPESDCPAVKFINDHFYGPQEYGIVATKA